MKITKLSEEITYQRISKEYVFDVNGKKVRVYTSDTQDPAFDNYDYDEDIDESDLEKLTDEEHEAIGENLADLFDLKAGESTEII